MIDVPKTMAGVYLNGHGGLEQLEYRRDIPVPRPGDDDVLIKVEAAGVNNTDINTRIGWYSKKIDSDTGAGGAEGFDDNVDDDGGWSGAPLVFPRIQGADCYGEVVAVGKSVDQSRIGEKVLVRTMLRAPLDFAAFKCWTFGSECDGGFAEYATAPSRDVYAVKADLTPVELGAVPCAYGTAEGMLVRANVSAGDRVLVTGASGGVGSAAVQLVKARGAEVVGLAAGSKLSSVLELGADEAVDRNKDLISAFGKQSFTVVIDLVGGNQFTCLPELLSRGGRYATAGAIAGPLVNFDLRTFYLNDLSFFGCTFQEDVVFENVIRFLEQGKLKPAVSATYPLSQIHDAQEKFLSKEFVGKIVLTPGGE